MYDLGDIVHTADQTLSFLVVVVEGVVLCTTVCMPRVDVIRAMSLCTRTVSVHVKDNRKSSRYGCVPLGREACDGAVLPASSKAATATIMTC